MGVSLKHTKKWLQRQSGKDSVTHNFYLSMFYLFFEVLMWILIMYFDPYSRREWWWMQWSGSYICILLPQSPDVEIKIHLHLTSDVHLQVPTHFTYFFYLQLVYPINWTSAFLLPFLENGLLLCFQALLSGTCESLFIDSLQTRHSLWGSKSGSTLWATIGDLSVLLAHSMGVLHCLERKALCGPLSHGQHIQN